jgi:hypothetical protein
MSFFFYEHFPCRLPLAACSPQGLQGGEQCGICSALGTMPVDGVEAPHLPASPLAALLLLASGIVLTDQSAFLLLVFPKNSQVAALLLTPNGALLLTPNVDRVARFCRDQTSESAPTARARGWLSCRVRPPRMPLRISMPHLGLPPPSPSPSPNRPHTKASRLPLL